MSGPNAGATNDAVLQTPITQPRRCGGNACATTARLTGTSDPPARPCTVRAVTRTGNDHAIPPTNAAIVNSARLPIIVRRPPKRSMSHAAPGCDCPRPIRYVVTTQSASWPGEVLDDRRQREVDHGGIERD